MKTKIKSLAWLILYMAIAIGVQLIVGIAMGVIILKIGMVTGIAQNREGIQQMLAEVAGYISTGLPLIVISFLVELILLACFAPWYYFRENKYDFRPDYRKAFSLKNVLCIIGIGYLGQYAISLLLALVHMVLPGIFQSYEELAENFDLGNGSPVLMIFFVCIFGPLAEEVVFRGMIYGKLRRAFSILPSLIISGVLFGIYHGNWVQGIYAAVFGMVLAYIYEKTQTIWGSYLLHAVFNLSSYIIMKIEEVIADVGLKIPVLAEILFYGICTVVVVILICQFRTGSEGQNLEENGAV